MAPLSFFNAVIDEFSHYAAGFHENNEMTLTVLPSFVAVFHVDEGY